MILKAKVEATLRYAAFFRFPLTSTEVWYWLVTERPVSLPLVEKQLQTIPRALKRWLIPKLTPTRTYRARISQSKLARGKRVASLLARIPGIKLVALTGSAAVGNSQAGDDLDLMVVTAADSLWLLRPLVVVLTELFFKRRHPHQGKRLTNAICLNLWLDEAGLKVPPVKHNLYTAHEVLQLVPLVNRTQTYEKFLAANRWTKKYLANTWQEKKQRHQLVAPAPRSVPPWSALNRLAFWLQYRYMQSKITKETVGLHWAYFHPRDWQKPIGRYLKQSKQRVL